MMGWAWLQLCCPSDDAAATLLSHMLGCQVSQQALLSALVCWPVSELKGLSRGSKACKLVKSCKSLAGTSDVLCASLDPGVLLLRPNLISSVS